MRNFVKLFQGVDIKPLQLAIMRRPELWKEDTYLRDYPQGPFGDTETIMLRFPVKTVKATQAEIDTYGASDTHHESIDYPAYKLLTEARPLVMNLMAYVQGERLGRVMINKLQPGGKVFPHTDTPSHTDYYSRFHIVLASNPDVTFRSGDEIVYMEPGSIWWFNNAKEHEVINNGNCDRIHVVVDIRTSK